MIEPVWLSFDDLVAFNREIVRRTGERHVLRDANLLASAVARGPQHWHYAPSTDLVELACKLLMGVVNNHPFEQGNKRTAFVAFVAFLEANGWKVDDRLDQSEVFAEIIEAGIVGHDEAYVLQRMRQLLEG